MAISKIDSVAVIARPKAVAISKIDSVAVIARPKPVAISKIAELVPSESEGSRSSQ